MVTSRIRAEDNNAERAVDALSVWGLLEWISGRHSDAAFLPPSFPRLLFGSNGSSRPTMVRIHPITLQFDDEDMEIEMRSGTLGSCSCVLILFCILDILCRAVFPWCNAMFDPASETNTAIAYTCIIITYATVLLTLRYAHTLPRHKAAALQDQLWTSSWVTNVAVWWAMVYSGSARRLTPADGQGASIICAMWAFVMVVQHTLFIGFRSRIIVLLMATSIALTSVAWCKELLAALMFGEAVGYSIEHMLRSSYLPRAPLSVLAWVVDEQDTVSDSTGCTMR